MLMRMRFRWLIVITCLGAAMWGGWAWLTADLPAPQEIAGHFHLPSVRILDREGRLLYEILPEEGGRHVAVPLQKVPLALRQATIATEDRSFYQHPGFDFVGMLRAVWINLQGGKTVAGGSTITQQVARNLLMQPGERLERTLRRKLREVILAWQLTRQFSKDQILELYLNQTYYGGMAYGVEAAAQTFFGKSVEQLDLAEAALIAGLPQAPALYNPFTDFAAAKARQEVVLQLMEEAGYITSEQHELASREPLVLAETPYPIRAPHFVMMVRHALDELLTPEQVFASGGVQVRTTLNLDWQGVAERAVQYQLELLKRSEDGLGHNVNSAALVALDPYNGDILALVGSPDYFDAEHGGAINMALTPRQPGSALKPILYAAALDPQRPGGAWTAATMLLDVRTAFRTGEGAAYLPENYDLREHGPVLLRQALASSLNVPAVITLDHIGLPALFAQAEKMGISTLGDPAQYDLSLALGGGEVRLLELTAAYGAFANGGFRVTPRLLLEVTTISGEVLYQAPQPAQVRVLDERVAWLISDILSDNDARRLGFGPYSLLRLDRPAAVKTGTTTNFHDNWTVGYTPGLVVGVWSGNTDYQPMREVNGLTGAAPIWHQFLRAVLVGTPEESFQRPAGLKAVEICVLSGLLPTEACPYRRTEWFIAGTEPRQPDHFYRIVVLDSATGALADANTPPERRLVKVVLDLPPQAHAWARSQGLTLLQDLSGGTTALASPSDGRQLFIHSPANGSIFRISQSFALQAQRLLLEALGQAGLQKVSLWLDGVQVAQFDQPPYQFWWILQPGSHQLWAQAYLADGTLVRSEVVTFKVED